MMTKIKILSPEQAIKIAAGEVVERPANIIKELVENSIDAKATKITIFIEQAGKQLIKIIDNGCGMSSDDALLSVAPHATSKIETVEDLESITTFGFRGEALASINAVSNLTLITKTADAQTASMFQWHYGKLQEQNEAVHPTGTTITVANLFDNIPARKKFLKKDETEWRAIVTLFQAFCLDYCNIHFQLYQDNALYLNCPATNTLSQRAAQLFDTQLQQKSLDLTMLENKLCSVTGIISDPTYYRYDRNQIFLFVNHRWVKNIELTKAVMKGYAGTLPHQKYPAAIIFITIDATQIDVNIHPKKEEVKFLHPKKIEALISQSIQATLATKISSMQSLHADQLFENKPTFTPAFHSNMIPEQSLIYTPQELESDFTAHENHILFSETIVEEQIAMPASVAHFFETDDADIQTQSIEEQQISTTQDLVFKILGQYKSTYILYEKDNQLYFVDQHAAHERILYEEFIKNFHNIPQITLLFPEFVRLAAEDIIMLAPHLELLAEHGIVAQIFSETQLLIQATPVHLKNQNLEEIIKQIVSWIAVFDETDTIRLRKILHEKIHTKMACAAAIKAGDALNSEQMEELLQRLYQTENRFACPHGRPTFWILQLDYLEKQFKRDYGKKAEQFYDFL